MYFCRSIHERQEFGYTKTLLRKQRTSVIFYSMDKNERIYNEQEMPAETKKNHSADADRVKEVYKVTIAGSIINVVLLVLKFAAGILGHSAAMIWTRMREYITSKRCPQKRKRIIPLMRIE